MPFNSNSREKWIERLVKRLIKKCEHNSILIDNVGERTHSIIQNFKWIETKCTALKIQESHNSLKSKFDFIVDGDIQEFVPEKRYGITCLGDTLDNMELGEAIKIYEKLLAESEFVLLIIPMNHPPKVEYPKEPDWTHEEVISNFNNLALHYLDHEMGVYVGVNPTLHTIDEVTEANRPLIGVYSIYNNEEKCIERFLHSIKDADEIVLCDTGSTDDTNSIIARFQETHQDLKLSIYRICVSPWRFDDARNTALSLVSPDVDVCISMDCDDFLMDGWKEHLKTHWDIENTSYFHKYCTIRQGNGATSEKWVSRIHVRTGYIWKLPVHEFLEYNGKENTKGLNDFWMYQKSEVAKSRHSYLPLLEQSIKERKDIWESWSFLAEAYFEFSRYEEAIKAIDTALSFENSDKGHLYQLKYLVYNSKGENDLALLSLNNAILFMPTRREIRFEKAKYLYYQGSHVEAFLTIREAEKISNKVNDDHYNESAWSIEFEDWKCKLQELAKKEGFEA
ncbi:glycosyltransferase [Peribacillus butanolivorans]|uniref:glycosyltransferase n=1 Tax=Peribacillus butanolivorans TaxID=421767 RepID=UPI003D2C9A1B